MSCAAPVGGVGTDGVDLARQSVIEGVVSRTGSPVEGAYVRLLDSSGEFAAEVATGESGRFRFFAAPGNWTVRALTAGTPPVERPVVARQGAITPVEVSV
jgi:hypothetical protein